MLCVPCRSGRVGWVLFLGILAIVCRVGFAADTNNYVSVTASALDSATPSISVSFYREDNRSIPKTDAVIYRTDLLTGTTDWGSPIATLPWGTTAFVDTNVEVGQRYLYRVDIDGVNDSSGNSKVQKNYVSGGIATPAVLDRGVMLLVTDNVTAPQLTAEIDRFKRDLIGDGYRVQEIQVSPTDTPQGVKAQIVAAYEANPTAVKSVTLLGNVPVAYSGWVNPDGHGRRPFPTDSYYADIDGTWTDSTRNSSNASRRSWWVNTPGDGKLDQSDVPSPVDLQIGRITFSNLSVFDETDVELMRRYLDKNHAYRQNRFTFDGNLYIGIKSETGYAASGPLFGTGDRPFIQTSAAESHMDVYWDEQESTGYWLTTWSRGGGSYTGTWGIGTSSDFAETDGVMTAIHAAWASYYGEWDVDNAFLRSILAARGQTVNTFYGGTPDWLLYSLGAGETVGFAAQMSTNQEYLGFGSAGDTVVAGLLGDPSIRLFPVTPPDEVEGKVEGKGIRLDWDASPDEGILGYLIFRAEDIDGQFVALTEDLLTDTTFFDDDPLATNLYMVRAIKLQETGSGSYLNPSQGAFTDGLLTVPEPTSIIAMLLGGIAIVRRRRRV